MGETFVRDYGYSEVSHSGLTVFRVMVTRLRVGACDQSRLRVRVRVRVGARVRVRVSISISARVRVRTCIQVGDSIYLPWGRCSHVADLG